MANQRYFCPKCGNRKPPEPLTLDDPAPYWLRCIECDHEDDYAAFIDPDSSFE